MPSWPGRVWDRETLLHNRQGCAQACAPARIFTEIAGCIALRDIGWLDQSSCSAAVITPSIFWKGRTASTCGIPSKIFSESIA